MLVLVVDERDEQGRRDDAKMLRRTGRASVDLIDAEVDSFRNGGPVLEDALEGWEVASR